VPPALCSPSRSPGFIRPNNDLCRPLARATERVPAKRHN
jgi:hypothetical protein